MKYKNFQVSYKLFFGILSALTLYSYYLYNVIDGSEIKDTYYNNYEIYTIDYFTTFTLLSNVLVHVWLIYSGIKHKNEGKTKLLSYTTANALATMITITFLVYNCVLIPVNGFPSSAFSVFTTLVDHAIVPVAFVIYVLFFMTGKQRVGYNEFFLKKFWIQFTLVLGYCIFAMVRGELRYANESYYSYLNSSGKVQNHLYPYFFLDVHHNGPMNLPGYVWFMIAFVGIIGIMIGFSYLYNFLSNSLIKKNYYRNFETN
ncbi:Pr6Pr family membrane protein [Spiroplasma apis]|uniref:Transmembrane protein n=1 Tax=Spiroplasma apis B31 TaxID=1276258 RepID=V5RL49_SPIAP|nr:Pr6Pr family membrane protein [Spiroplasma apis]AHB36520.1 hypothetical protein SAPIS_v1c06750 [Spiroplasma apis B31]